MSGIACQAVDHQVSFVADPFAGQQLLEQGFIEMPGPVIHILWRSPGMA
jgi:hypothetical protein